MNLPALPTEGSDERTGTIPGVAVGIVADNEDPDGLARVKLTFPWRGTDDQSYWARIATPMAGDDRGTYFLPEVGDEVLVAFEDGDIHHPYVLGALWNGQEKPPEDNAGGTNDVRKIRSKSGHEIVLDDSDSEAKVEITTNAGHRIVLDDAAGKEKIAIEDKSGQNTITFDSNQGAVELAGGTKLAISAPMIEIKGDGNVDIEAGGILTLKGSLIKVN